MRKIKLEELRGSDLKAIELQGSLGEKQLSLKDTGINTKAFHYWKSNGLVSFVNDGNWVKISFVEYIWLKVLEAMRGFGCPVRVMQKIHYEQFIKAYEENLFERTLQENIAYYRSLSKIRGLTNEEKLYLQETEATLEDKSIVFILRTEVSYFYQKILECIIHERETGIVIYPDETYTMMGGNDDEVDLSRPHIFIPFSYFIAELFADKDKEAFVKRLGLLNDNERRVVEELRNNNVEKITITFDKVNRTLKKIEYDRSGLIEGDKAKEVMRLLGIRNYAGIKLSTRNGTTLSFTKTEKKFIE